MSKKYESWGKYPKYPQSGHQPHWRENIAYDFPNVLEKYRTTLPYGNGRSYGDSCLAESDNIICMRPLNRFVSFDTQKGVVVAEAGITLDEILAVVIPEGWFYK